MTCLSHHQEIEFVTFPTTLTLFSLLPECHVIKVNSPLQRRLMGLITRAQIKITHMMMAVQRYRALCLCHLTASSISAPIFLAL